MNDCITGGVLHPTVEGENGVGKTSLVSVAQYRLWREFNENDGIPFIPIKTTELRSNDTAASFTRSVMFDVAHAFIKHRKILKRRGYHFPDSRNIERWISDPVNRSRTAGVSALSFGTTFGGSRTSNTSPGFAESGFPSAIMAWLEECFPDRSSGGFVCTIDNLELLRTARASINALESMRDALFKCPGLFWVLCGSNHVTRTLVQTPRLRGRLDDPIELSPVGDGDVREILKRRFDVYAVRKPHDAPVDADDFYFIYATIGKQLRDAFKYAECFSSWFARERPVVEPSGRSKLLKEWLTGKGKEHESSQPVRLKVRERGWQLFDRLADAGGYCIYSQHQEFGFPGQQSMRDQIARLVDVGLVRQDTDVSANGRRVMSLTPIGWLVARARGVVHDVT
ncbi:hypothetical protein ACH4C6_01745 [Streptomyces sp. NPDC017943]|uniref:hypothetical protein n=1 Tax=Streptomyces sp. NPDC017943 TaxID=3365019 RepID=UPI00379AEA16